MLTYCLGGSPRLVCRHLLDCALDLNEVDILVAQFNDAFQDGLHLGKFVLVSGDEVQVLGDCGGHVC